MSKLFSPATYRGMTLKNRVIVAPMFQYSAQHGFANDWHLVERGPVEAREGGLYVVRPCFHRHPRCVSKPQHHQGHLAGCRLW